MQKSTLISEGKVSYLFVPFVPEDKLSPDILTGRLDSSPCWERQINHCGYMFRYISENLTNQNDCLCVHYVRTAEGQESAAGWQTQGSFYGNTESFLTFQINAVHLFCFRTGMCISALEIEPDSSDPVQISSLHFCLKNAGRVMMERCGTQERLTPLDFLRQQISDVIPAEQVSFSFLTAERSIRANILSLQELAEGADREYALFYLRRCYNESYEYQKDEERDREELCSFAGNLYWGVTSEAAACVAVVKDSSRDFIRGPFFRNFKTNYLFMYILLLHQKYTLYRFLTRIGRCPHNRLEILETYREELYNFETDYMFACITEVPQYQMLYERISHAFSLDALYNDVHEPLQELRELRIAARDRKLNLALTLLSLLSCASAMGDGLGLIDGAEQYLYRKYDLVCDLSALVVLWGIIVAGTFLYVMYQLFRRDR